MRALQFMKIDYIKTKQQAVFLPVFWLIAFAFGLGQGSMDSETALVSACTYLMFTVMLFATSPFGTCDRRDAGFLVLLPSTVADRVLGRFLYGFSLMAVSAAVMGIITLARRAMGLENPSWTQPVCLILFAGTILITVCEFLFFYLFGENKGQQLLSIVRITPGMVFFFVINGLMKSVADSSGEMPEGMPEALLWFLDHLSEAGLWGLAIAVIAAAGAVCLCIKVTAKRDYS